jgi:hypothetical protein
LRKQPGLPDQANQVRGVEGAVAEAAGRRGGGAFFGGAAISPSRMASLRAALRLRRTASPFSRARRSEGFS